MIEQRQQGAAVMFPPVVDRMRADLRADCLGAKTSYPSRFLSAYTLTLIPLAMVLFGVYCHPVWPGLLALWWVTGFTQNALGILMHEGSHYFFHGNSCHNDRMADFLVCMPIFNTVAGYRAPHMEHHRHVGDAKDPHFFLYGEYRSKRQVLLGCVADLTGITSLLAFRRRYIKGGQPRRQPWYYLPGMVLVHGFLFALYAVCAHWLFAYLVFWFLPLLIVPALVNRIRTFVEHQPLEPGETANRSTIPTWLEYLIIAPYGYAFHFEHHLQLNIPFHQLAHAHHLLQDQGHTFTTAELSPFGYFRTFWFLLRRLP